MQREQKFNKHSFFVRRDTDTAAFGATTLNSTLTFSTFAVLIVLPGFVRLVWLLLKARDGRGGVIRPMSAIVHRAGQHKLASRHRPAFTDSLTGVEGKQNWRAALFAAYAEIPPRFGFGPSRNVHNSKSRFYQKCRGFAITRLTGASRYSTPTRKTVQEESEQIDTGQHSPMRPR
jgi:hypothetical protein